MSAALTIILPHKKEPRNTDALNICLDCLMRNTVNDFALIVDACADEPIYPRINTMAKMCKTECFVYWASDIFAAPSWDIPMLERWTPDRIVTGILVEPGAMAVHGQNLQLDFGRKPETFRRADFEQWTQKAPMLDGEGFYCPYMISAEKFLAFGGLETDLEAPDGFTFADINFFARWKAAGNCIVRARSYAYHLQRWSDVGEQEAVKRR